MASGGSHYFNLVEARRRDYGGGSDIERGLQAGQAVGKLLGGLGAAIKGARQDAAANALMNAQPTAEANAQALQDPDPDPLAGGEDNLTPTAATDPSGTQNPTPFTGGVEGMKLQQDFQKDQLAQEIQKADLADKLAKAGGTGYYARRATPVTSRGVTMSGDSVWDSTNPPPGYNRSGGTKEPKYVPGTGDYENDENTDEATQIRADFEAFHPGLFPKFQGATRDEQGNYIIPGKGKGTSTVDANGQVVETPPPPEAVISKEEGDIFTQRIQAAKRRSGVPFTDPELKASGMGTADKPLIIDSSTPQSKLRIRSLPVGTVVQDAKTGQRFTIKRRAAP
jgi:hypothetical protein